MTLPWGPAHDSPWETKPNEEGGNLQWTRLSFCSVQPQVRFPCHLVGGATRLFWRC